MNTSLAQFEAWLSSQRPAFLQQLNPAASSDELDSLQQILPCSIPGEFCDYLSWRDGQPIDSETLYNNKRLMSLRRILSATEILNSCTSAGEFPSDNWWLNTWLPFAEDGGGNHIVLDCKTGLVHEFWKSDADRPVVSDSFGHWLDGLLKMFTGSEWLLERGSYILAADSTAANPYEKVSVVLLRTPNGGLSVLKKIYDQLALSYGIGKLFADSKTGPVTLFSNIYYTDACRLLSRVDDPSPFQIQSDENAGKILPIQGA